MFESYYFKPLERHELDDCLKLVTRLFVSYDPFINELKLTEQELFNRAKAEFESTLDDQLITICKTKNSEKIIGCFAGFKWSNKNYLIKPLSKIKTQYKIDEKLTQEERFGILVDIDAFLLGDAYEMRKRNQELEFCVHSDYFCISEEYFNSNLKLELMNFHLQRLKTIGIKFVYGSFFNAKAIKLVANNMPFENLKELVITLEDSKNKQKVFKILLLFYELQKIDFNVSVKPKL